MVELENDWQELLASEFASENYLKLRDFLKEAYQSDTVYPPMEDIFTALRVTSYADTKVVILGQDPYHGPNQAHGLAFSVQNGVRIPPSLVNIYKELHDDLHCPIPQTGNLLPWAEEGVLLLNTTLTVFAGRAKSHAGQGWEILTDRIIELLAEREEPLVFILWGAHAQSKEHIIEGKGHKIIKSAHPSPLSAFGSKPFSQTNEFLMRQGQIPINWCSISKGGKNHGE